MKARRPGIGVAFAAGFLLLSANVTASFVIQQPGSAILSGGMLWNLNIQLKPGQNCTGSLLMTRH